MLTHPFTSLELPPPFKDPIEAEFGLAVIEIHIPKLMVQYFGFRNSQEGHADTYGPQSFIARYVWPNMLQSHFDQAWFNRLYANASGSRVRNSSFESIPFQYMDLTRYFDSSIQAIEQSLSKLRNNTVAAMLKTVPMIGADDLYSALILPDVAPTQQVTWALDVSRIKHLLFALKAGNGNAITASRDVVVQAVRSLQQNHVIATAKQILPSQVNTIVDIQLEQLMSYYSFG